METKKKSNKVKIKDGILELPTDDKSYENLSPEQQKAIDGMVEIVKAEEVNIDGEDRSKLRQENKGVTERLARVMKAKYDLAEAQDKLDKKNAYEFVSGKAKIGFIHENEK